MQTQRKTVSPLVNADVLLQRAREMVPRLAARADAAAAARMLPAETIADMQAAGFFEVLNQRQYGG